MQWENIGGSQAAEALCQPALELVLSKGSMGLTLLWGWSNDGQIALYSIPGVRRPSDGVLIVLIIAFNTAITLIIVDLQLYVHRCACDVCSFCHLKQRQLPNGDPDHRKRRWSTRDVAFVVPRFPLSASSPSQVHFIYVLSTFILCTASHAFAACSVSSAHSTIARQPYTAFSVVPSALHQLPRRRRGHDFFQVHRILKISAFVSYFYFSRHLKRPFISSIFEKQRWEEIVKCTVALQDVLY